MVALTNFANILLSSLYFDITKDVLYANDVSSIERRVVVDTLKRVSFNHNWNQKRVSCPSLDTAKHDIGIGPSTPLSC